MTSVEFAPSAHVVSSDLQDSEMFDYERTCIVNIPREEAAFATNGSPRVYGPQILIRAPGLTNLGDCLSPTTTVTLRMIYLTTGEIMFTLDSYSQLLCVLY